MPLPPTVAFVAVPTPAPNNYKRGEGTGMTTANESTDGHEQDGTARKQIPPPMQLQEEENTMTMPDMGPTKEPMEDGPCNEPPTPTGREREKKKKRK